MNSLLKATASTLALGVALGLGSKSAEASACYVSDDATGYTMAAITNSYVSGNYTVVSLQVANYTHVLPQSACNDSRIDAFHSLGVGGFSFSACGHIIYYGSSDSTHLVGDWSTNCNAAFVVI